MDSKFLSLILRDIKTVDSADDVFSTLPEQPGSADEQNNNDRIDLLNDFRRRLSKCPPREHGSLPTALLACEAAPRCLSAALFVDILRGKQGRLSLVASLAFLDTLVHVPAALQETAFQSVFNILGQSESIDTKHDARFPSQKAVTESVVAFIESLSTASVPFAANLLAVMADSFASQLEKGTNRSIFYDLPRVYRAASKLNGSQTVPNSETGHIINGGMILLKSMVHVAQQCHKLSKSMRDQLLAVVKQIISAGAPEAGLTFVQHVSLKPLESAEARHASSEVIAEIFQDLNCNMSEKAVDWFRGACSHQSITMRLFILEIIGKLKARDEDLSCNLRRTCIDRMSDSASSVRAKAVSTFCLVIESDDKLRSKGTQEACIDPSQAKQLIDIVLRRLSEEKSGVRKAALDLVGMLLRSKNVTDEGKFDLLHECMVARSTDSVSTVRRAAIVALTDSIRVRGGSQIAKNGWKRGVLPRIVDTDVRVQETCLSSFQEVVFDNLILNESSQQYQTVTSLLCEIERDDPYLMKYSRAIVSHMLRQASMDKKLLRAFQTACLRDQSFAWPLLEAASSSCNELEKLKFLDMERLATKVTEIPELNSYSLTIFAKFGENLSTKTQAAIASHVFERLKNFTLADAETLRCALAALDRFSKSPTDDIEYLFRMCHQFVCLSSATRPLESSKIFRALSTVSQLLSSRQFMIPQPFVETLMFLSSRMEEDAEHGNVKAFSLVILAKLCLTQTKFEGQTTQGALLEFLTGILHSPNPDFQDFVRRCVPVFVKELQDGSTAARANAVIVLSDLCRAFTSVVEPYVNRLAARLQDKSVFVRKQTILSLASLIQEDFLKCRAGPLLFPLLRSAVDSNAEISKLARYSLLEVLTKKNAQLFALSIVEIILHLNDCVSHASYKNVSLRDLGFTKCNVDARRGIYSLILSSLSSEQKLVTHCRLVREILNAIVDNDLDLGSPGAMEVLRDCLDLMTSRDLNCLAPKGFAKECDGEDPTSSDQTQGKKSLRVSMRQELGHRTIPVLLELKIIFAKDRSPLVGRLSKVILSLVRDFKTELGELLNNHQIVAELEYDFAEEEAKNKDWEDVRPRPSTVKNKRPPTSFSDDDVVFLSTEDVHRSAVKRRRLSCALRKEPVLETRHHQDRTVGG